MPRNTSSTSKQIPAPSAAIPLAHHPVGLGTHNPEIQAERSSVCVGVGQERRVVHADDERRVGKRFLEVGIAADMIGVPMRVQDQRGLETALAEKVKNERAP